MEEKKMFVDTTPDMRKGVHANYFTLTDDGDEMWLDCFNVDRYGDDGSSYAVLSSRIYLSEKNLAALEEVISNRLNRADGDKDAKEE